jgi:nitroreductase
VITEIIHKNRSYRRFKPDIAIDCDTLRELVDLARHSPSAANRQPLKYALSYTPERNALIFPHLAWAGYLKDWSGPEEGERPAAYIVILRYWRDKAGIHHVPKRKLDDIIMGEH